MISEIVTNTNAELKEDGHPQNLRNTNVFYTAKSEYKLQNRLSLQSYDLSDLNQLWIEESKLKDPFLRHVGLPLQKMILLQWPRKKITFYIWMQLG